MAYNKRLYGEKDPVGVAQMYPSLESFRLNWCRQKIIIELLHSLLTFEDHDLYEHADVIQQELDKKVDKMLEGIFNIKPR